MSQQTFYIKRNDREPSIEAQFFQDGVAINLSGCTVRFLMRNARGVLKINAIASLVDAIGGKARYDWLSADTDTAGRFQAEWEITKPSGKLLTVPTVGQFAVVIYEDLNPITP